MATEYDFIAVGDITTDAFIKLKKENTTIFCDESGRKCKLCMNFGDKIEYESVTEVYAVGNSPNAAVAARRLGLRSALVTNMGDDLRGKQKIAQLEKEGIPTDFVKVHKGKDSNYHFVLWYEEERTILVKHNEYPYEMPDIGTPQWLYLSSLGENSVPLHHAIADYIQTHPETKLAFQPGTFQMKLGYETLKDVYAVSELFFCNLQEAQRILKTEERDAKKLLDGIRALGPKIAVITDGPKGAHASDGTEKWYAPMYPDPAPPIDRTGAGDAFASTFTAMLALGKTLPEALLRAPINSMAVVQKIGAQEGLLTMDEIGRWLTNAPENYRVEKLL
ncbi:MAG: carbohydrate kinase family protein [Parcubacteria group bacterium]|nr:carbohydrate kinase family protein [Parcubacteria group bacterium]